jgi:hypothetical protein
MVRLNDEWQLLILLLNWCMYVHLLFRMNQAQKERSTFQHSAGKAPFRLSLRMFDNHFIDVLRGDYGPTFTQRKGVTDPLPPCGPSLRPPQGPDVRLPKIVTFPRGYAAARALIVPLTKTRRRTIKVHDCVAASPWSLRCVNLEP